MMGAHVCVSPKDLVEPPLYNEVHYEESFVRTALTVPVHCHGWEGGVGVPQGGGGGTQAASHQQSKNLNSKQERKVRFVSNSKI